MSSVSAGLRKVTPVSLEAIQQARRYVTEDIPLITKIEALRVAKDYAAALRMGASKIAVLDNLFAYTKPQDWTTPGVSPVIWPSNEALAQRVGIHVSTLKHHLNGLAHAGIISYEDGPTYQRRGYRDANDRIVSAQGISLAVLAVRYDEFQQVAEAYAYANKKRKRLSNSRTILRKSIQSLLDAARRDELEGHWSRFQARLDVYRERKAADNEELEAIVDGLQDLQNEVEDAFERASLDVNFNTALSKFRPQQTTEESQKSESSNQMRPRANARDSNLSSASGGMALEEKPGENRPSEQHRSRGRALDDLSNVSLGLIQRACPVLERLVPGSMSDWMKLRSCGRELTIAGGINPQLWQEACDRVGPDMAISALAVTLEKAGLGTVEKPGAYMRRLVQLGHDDKLFISRSLFALAGGVPTPLPESNVPPPSLPAFPMTGGISFTHWAELVRTHAPNPTPDVEIVAQDFRNWLVRGHVSPEQPNVETLFIRHCKKWTPNRFRR